MAEQACLLGCAYSEGGSWSQRWPDPLLHAQSRRRTGWYLVPRQSVWSWHLAKHTTRMEPRPARVFVRERTG